MGQTNSQQPNNLHLNKMPLAFVMAMPQIQPKKENESRNAQQREHDQKY
jgi:hypothetical protein